MGQGVNRLEVLWYDIFITHRDGKVRLEVCDELHDSERIDDAVLYQAVTIRYGRCNAFPLGQCLDDEIPDAFAGSC